MNKITDEFCCIIAFHTLHFDSEMATGPISQLAGKFFLHRLRRLHYFSYFSVHESHCTHWTFPMARPKCPMRDLQNLNCIYKARRTNVFMNHESFTGTLILTTTCGAVPLSLYNDVAEAGLPKMHRRRVALLLVRSPPDTECIKNGL